MTANEYAAMFRAVPTRDGLAAVGHAFMQECKDGAARLDTAEMICDYSIAQKQKWREFCRLVEPDATELQPQADAYEALTPMLLSLRGIR